MILMVNIFSPFNFLLLRVLTVCLFLSSSSSSLFVLETHQTCLLSQSRFIFLLFDKHKSFRFVSLRAKDNTLFLLDFISLKFQQIEMVRLFPHILLVFIIVYCYNFKYLLKLCQANAILIIVIISIVMFLCAFDRLLRQCQITYDANFG